MSVSDLAIVSALIFIWATLSARLERFDVTAPITFILAGLVLTHGPLAPLGYAPSNGLVKTLAEVTLVLVLFSDASRVGLRDLRTDMGLCIRLLAIGLPLTIGLGTLIALPVVGTANPWLALLVGAALAPTNAALGTDMMINPAVPVRIRRLINVESGLNDGIATPFVLIALAGLGSSGHAAGIGPAKAAAELVLGVAIGAVLALAVCAYACSLALHGNGFIAAFVGGLAYRAAGGERGERMVPFVEETSALVSLLVWFGFGAVAVVPA